MGLFALPLLGSALLSPLGFSLPFQKLRDVTFIFIVALGISRRRDVERAGIMLAVVGIFLGLGAMLSVVSGPNSLFPLAVDLTAPRAAGPFQDPNFFGLAMASLMPFALEVYERPGTSNRLLGLVSALSIVTGILATGSRGSC